MKRNPSKLDGLTKRSVTLFPKMTKELVLSLAAPEENEGDAMKYATFLGRQIHVLYIQIAITCVFLYCLYHYLWETSFASFSLWVLGLFETEKKIITRDYLALEKAHKVTHDIISRLENDEIGVDGELNELQSILQERLVDTGVVLNKKLFLTFKFNDVYQKIKQNILSSESIQKEIQKDAANEAKAVKMLNKMASQQSRSIIKFTVRMFSKIVHLLFPLGIQINGCEVLTGIREKGIPAILLPTHKSHMDYIMIHYICAALEVPIPFAVAGENLDMRFFGTMMRRMGAFYIRRSFAGDKLYTAVFNKYIEQLLVRNCVIECFIEGTRSRSGKLLAPKAGFLKSILDAAIENGGKDVMIIPISMSYDRVVESDSMIAELQGGKKVAERSSSSLKSILFFIHGGFMRYFSFGRVVIDVAEPILLKKHLEERKIGREEWNLMDHKARMAQSTSLGYRCLYAMNDAATILPTAIVGTILLNKTERAVKEDEIVSDFDWLTYHIRKRGGKVVTGSTAELVNVVLQGIIGTKHKTLLKKHKAHILTELFRPKERLELSTLRNQLIHLFVGEAFIACSTHKILRESNDALASPIYAESEIFRVTRAKLLENLGFLSGILKLEFIFKPPRKSSEDDRRSNLEINFESTMDSLINSDVFFKQDNLYELRNSGDGMKLFLFLCKLLNPTIDSYFVTVFSFLDLTIKQMTYTALIENAQSLAEKLYFESELDNYESVSKDAMANAVSNFTDMKVVECSEVAGVREKVYRLGISKPDLIDLISRVNNFRRKPYTKLHEEVECAERETTEGKVGE